MADDTERLVVLLEARIRDFEKNMQKASGTAGQQYGRMRRDSRSATRQMEQDMQRSTSRINQALASSTAAIGRYGRAFATGLVGGIAAGGVAGIAAQINQVAKSVAAVGDEAKRAGVSVEAFQEWKFVAEQNRIGIDQMVDGLKELNLRADEFTQTGKGPAAEAFMRLGYSAEELQRKLKNPSELLLEIIARLGKMDRAAQIRIADEIFGGSAGERFVELLDQGEQGIRNTIEEAHRLGVVMDEEVIEKAAELDRRFNAITTSISTGLKTAIVEAADALQDFINRFNTWWDEKQRNMDRMRGAGPAGLRVGAMAGNTDALADIVRTTPKTDRLPKAEFVPPTPPPGGFGGSGSSKRDAAAAAAEREAQALARLISELQEELRLVGATSTEKQIAATLRRANVDAASAEGQQIASLVAQIEAETEALERNKQAQEARADSIDYLFGVGEQALSSIVDGSVRAEDAIKRLAVQLALAAAQAALLGTGPLAGFFGGGGLGSLFGRADPWAGLRSFDGGGFTGMGARTGGIDGKGGFPAILHPRETVVDHTKASGGGQGVAITVQIDGANGDDHVRNLVAQGVERGLKEYDRTMPARLGGHLNQGRRMGSIR